MLGLFSLRLAVGVIGCLLLLRETDHVNPRFYRTHFLVGFALAGLNAIVWDSGALWFWFLLGLGMAGAFGGAVVSSVEGAPLRACFLAVAFLGFAGALGLAEWQAGSRAPAETFAAGRMAALADAYSAAALLGAALTAMLLGHFYLIAPGMAMKPLLRLLGALFVALLLRSIVAGAVLFSFTRERALVSLEDIAILWLPVRWLVGLAVPAVLAGMARAAAQIRSTQSATGMLYAVVILCFLGELTSLLLRSSAGLF